MEHFKNILKQEYKALLNFPVYISLLAANSIGDLDKTERKTAIKFAHTKTFTCDPLLAEFYLDVNDVFEKNIEQLDEKLPKGKESRDEVIKNEILILDKIVLKLGNDFAKVMHKSMISFTAHVLKAHINPLADFILSFLPGY